MMKSTLINVAICSIAIAIAVRSREDTRQNDYFDLPSNMDVTDDPDSSTTVAEPSSCATMASSPSLAPAFVYGGAHNGTRFWRSDTQKAEITPTNSTVFQFLVSQSFPSASFASQSHRCAIQFRLPFCSDLPDKYPCFEWTGLEQEVLSNAGLFFGRVSATNVTWSSTGLVQIEGGTATTGATFPCGADASNEGIDVMNWLATSHNGLQIKFLQGGARSGFGDGVGVWIVACL